MNVKCCNSCKSPLKSCKMHSHKYWEIILQAEGDVTTRIGDTDYKITAGDVFIIPPGTCHGGMSTTYYKDMYLQAENLDIPNMSLIHDYDGSIRTLFMLLHKTMTEKENNYMIISDCILETICEFIRKNTVKNYKYSFVNHLKNVLYSNISNPDFKIAEEIKKTGFNDDYVRRCFKEELNKTPLEYYTYLKMRTAKKLLVQQSFLGVENIAELCGYSDSFYFSKAFKKIVGLSPLNYRKKHLY